MVTFLIDQAIRKMQRTASGARRLASAARAAWNRGAAEVPESETEYGAGLLYHLQGRRLRAALKRAAAESPFYRELLGTAAADIRDVTDLHSLPFTDQDAFADWRRFIAVPMDQIARTVTSAGTFGQPKAVVFTRDDWNQVCTSRSVAIGALLPKRRAAGHLRALLLLPSETPMWAETSATSSALTLLGVDILSASTSDPESAVRWLVEYRPQIIAGSAAALWEISRCAEDVRFSYQPELLLCLGESCPADMVERLTSQWSCAPTVFYGSAEIGGSQTITFPGCRGLHLNTLDFIWEVIDPQSGEPAPMGELVVTTLLRRAMPLIRYRTGDIARRVSHSCRLPFPAVEILGPDETLVWAGNRFSAAELSARVRTHSRTAGRVEISADGEQSDEILRCVVEGDPTDRDYQTRLRSLLSTDHRAIADGSPESARFELTVNADLSSQPKLYRVLDRRTR